jgi:peroxiredoxin Q/BCP
MPNENREMVSKEDLLGQLSIIFFYPKDGSPGCTVESCGFRDKHEQIVKAGGKLYGVSQDGVTSHQNFKKAHKLPYMLLSDRKGEVAKKLKLKKTLGLLRTRVTLIVDKQGIIQGTHTSQFNPYGHIKFSIKLLNKLSS